MNRKNTIKMLKGLGFGKKLTGKEPEGVQVRLMQEEQWKKTGGKYGRAPAKSKMPVSKTNPNIIKFEHPEITKARQEWDEHDGKGNENYYEEMYRVALRKHGQR